MNIFVIYRLSDGEIQSKFTGSEDLVQLQIKDGYGYLQCDKTDLDGYIKNGQFVEYSTKQKKIKNNYPGIGREWSNDTMNWIDTRSADDIYTSTANEVRAERDRLIAETDWTQLPDVQTELAAAWATYRQVLRDVPQQEGFPFSIQWPEKP